MEHLDEAVVAGLLDQAEVADTMAAVFAEWAEGSADSTVRVRAATPAGMASAMAAVVPSLGVTGGKIYATKDGRFTFHVVLFDLDGRLLCTMDGGALTAARTPALCAVAVRLLAPAGASVAAVLGTGLQARPHVEMLLRELDLDELRLWGRSPTSTEELAAESRKGAEATVTAVDRPAAAVAGADVVVTVTSSDEPLVPAEPLGAPLICAVGATKPQRRELEPDVFAGAAAIVTDSVEGARTECGDLIGAVAAGCCSWDDVVEFRDVVAGTAPVERAGGRGPVVFETQGVAIQDVATAALVWHRYLRHDSPGSNSL